MRTKRNNKKGFTLVECIVAITVVSIIAASVIGLFRVSYNLDTGVSELFKAKNIANTALKAFECSSDYDEFIGKLSRENGGVDADALVNKTSEGAEVTFDDKYKFDEVKVEHSSDEFVIKFFNDGTQLFSLSFSNKNESDYMAAVASLKSEDRLDLLTEKYSFTEDIVSGSVLNMNRFKARFVRNFTVDYTKNTVKTNELSNFAKAIEYSNNFGVTFSDSRILLSRDPAEYKLSAIGDITHTSGKDPKTEILDYLKSHNDTVMFEDIKVLNFVDLFDNELTCNYQNSDVVLELAEFKCSDEKITLNKADFGKASSSETSLVLYDSSNRVFFSAKNFKNFDEKDALADSTSQTKSESSYYSFNKQYKSTKTIVDYIEDGKHKATFGDVTVKLDNDQFNEIKKNIGDYTTYYRTENYGASGKDIQIDEQPYYRITIKNGFDVNVNIIGQRTKTNREYYLSKNNRYFSLTGGDGDSYFFSESEKNEFLSTLCFKNGEKWYYGFKSAEKTESGILLKDYYIELKDKKGNSLYYCKNLTNDGFLYNKVSYSDKNNRDTDYSLLFDNTATYENTKVYCPMEVTVEECYSVYYAANDVLGVSHNYYFNGTNFRTTNSKYTSAANKDKFVATAGCSYNFSDTLTVTEAATLYPYSVLSEGSYDDKYVFTVKNKSVDYIKESGLLSSDSAYDKKSEKYKKDIGNRSKIGSTAYDMSRIYSKAVYTGEKLNFINKLGEVIFSTDCTAEEINAYLKNNNNHTVSPDSGNDYIYDETKKIKLKVIYSFPYANVVNADDDGDIIFRHELTKDQYEAIVGEEGASSGIGENFTSITENLTIVPYVSEKDGITRYSVIVFTDFRNRKCVAFVVRGDFTKNEEDDDYNSDYDNKIFNNLSVNGYFAFDENGKKCVKGTESTENKVPILYETIVYSKG